MGPKTLACHWHLLVAIFFLIAASSMPHISAVNRAKLDEAGMMVPLALNGTQATSSALSAAQNVPEIRRTSCAQDISNAVQFLGVANKVLQSPQAARQIHAAKNFVDAALENEKKCNGEVQNARLGTDLKAVLQETLAGAISYGKQASDALDAASKS